MTEIERRIENSTTGFNSRDKRKLYKFNPSPLPSPDCNLLACDPREDGFPYNMLHQVALEVVLLAGGRRHELYNLRNLR